MDPLKRPSPPSATAAFDTARRGENEGGRGQFFWHITAGKEVGGRGKEAIMQCRSSVVVRGREKGEEDGGGERNSTMVLFSPFVQCVMVVKGGRKSSCRSKEPYPTLGDPFLELYFSPTPLFKRPEVHMSAPASRRRYLSFFTTYIAAI